MVYVKNFGSLINIIFLFYFPDSACWAPIVTCLNMVPGLAR